MYKFVFDSPPLHMDNSYQGADGTFWKEPMSDKSTFDKEVINYDGEPGYYDGHYELEYDVGYTKTVATEKECNDYHQQELSASLAIAGLEERKACLTGGQKWHTIVRDPLNTITQSRRDGAHRSILKRSATDKEVPMAMPENMADYDTSCH